MRQGICSIEGCERFGKLTRGWCAMHYKRAWRYGDPLLRRSPRGTPAIERFGHFVRMRADGCWEWTGARTRTGYGSFTDAGSRKCQAHRFAYEHLVGPIPNGLELDHLCRNRWCVSPSHLQPVTHRENQRRGIKGILTTHCPKGHPYSEENTRMYGGHRFCKTCGREGDRRRSDRLKADRDEVLQGGGDFRNRY